MSQHNGSYKHQIIPKLRNYVRIRPLHRRKFNKKLEQSLSLSDERCYVSSLHETKNCFIFISEGSPLASKVCHFCGIRNVRILGFFEFSSFNLSNCPTLEIGGPNHLLHFGSHAFFSCLIEVSFEEEIY